MTYDRSTGKILSVELPKQEKYVLKISPERAIHLGPGKVLFDERGLINRAPLSEPLSVAMPSFKGNIELPYWDDHWMGLVLGKASSVAEWLLVLALIADAAEPGYPAAAPILGRFIDGAQNIDTPDGNGATMLMWLLYQGKLDLAERLIARKANLHPKGSISISEDIPEYYGGVLQLAVARKDPALLDLLAATKRLDVNMGEWDSGKKAFSSWTALHMALFSPEPSLEIVKKLVEMGASLTATWKDSDGYVYDALTILLSGSTSQNPATWSIYEYLLGQGLKPNLEDGKLLAAAVFHPLSLADLLARGARPDTPYIDGRTPLIIAVGNGLKESARLIVASGADPLLAVSVLDNQGKAVKITAMDLALERKLPHMRAILEGNEK
ncbi:MAG: hypothetical protein Q8M76_11630 [Spirochaetaceae bacterium]|nr:hypothetical protein [Spirochaetaceae bacterium]